MAANCWPILVSALLGAGPAAGPAGPISEAPVEMTAAAVPCEPRFPFDCPQPWLHGYIQEIPAYAGFHAFRPYNYKHVYSQSQIAAGWGLSPLSPYSQQYWHRDRPAAANAEAPQITPTAIVPVAGWQSLPGSPR
jgi:hypothetical protein